jgi:hypothetical protein
MLLLGVVIHLFCNHEIYINISHRLLEQMLMQAQAQAQGCYY